jgi:stearoyl-CoA desaturase (delta-9 desaturase)
MKNLSSNFWKLFLPLHILAFFGLFFASKYLFSLLVFWFIIGVIGNGVSAHRYFAHGQFETYTPIRYILATLATLGGIGPISFWTIQHKLHHISSDTLTDPHSPKNMSIWDVFYGWTFPQNSNQNDYLKYRWAKRIMVSQMKDPLFIFFHKYHYKIIYLFCIILYLINPIYVLIYALAYAIDFLRLGMVNYICHSYGYRNHDTSDDSRNNVILGILSMGFGWHNNHHAHPGKLILTEHWWEIDVEGYIGYLLSKKNAEPIIE